MKAGLIIALQAVFLTAVIIGIWLVYPFASVNLEGNVINFKSEKPQVIVISENPDFSNARYLDIIENVSIKLNPGTYYWKSRNGIIESVTKTFTIDSEVGIEISRQDNNSELVNVGNVRVNVTRTNSGVMVGRIILEPNESEQIEDSGSYTGRQE